MRPAWRELAAVFAGGAAGALARVGLLELFPSAEAGWPWAVLAINVSGALLLGYLVTRLQERPARYPYWRQLMGTGFCGAYTTFSTMQLELLHMVDAHNYGLAAGYLGVSVVCGYVAIQAATAIIRRSRAVA